MAKGFGNKGSWGRVMATFTLVNVSEDCLALVRLHTALVHTSDTVPNQHFVDYGVCRRPSLHLSGQGLVGWQLFVYQEFEDGLSP